MPLPVANQSDKKKTGPPPICDCNVCSVCKNRERQRKFRERQKLKGELGIDGNDEGLLDSIVMAGGDNE